MGALKSQSDITYITWKDLKAQTLADFVAETIYEAHDAPLR